MANSPHFFSGSQGDATPLCSQSQGTMMMMAEPGRPAPSSGQAEPLHGWGRGDSVLHSGLWTCVYLPAAPRVLSPPVSPARCVCCRAL